MRIKDSEVIKVLDILRKTHPDARCELDHTTPFELLVATILSAQCTDVRVNMVTKELFKKYSTPEDFYNLPIEVIEEEIKTCGFYRNKARNIKGTSQILVDEYNSTVPSSIEELVTLPGVGKKTANVVASNAYGIPAIAVDTHVFRVSNRIGIVDAKNAEDTENQLMERIPKDRWIETHHQLIFHGRRICKARKPLCEECSVRRYCLAVK